MIRLEVIICELIGEFSGRGGDHDAFAWIASEDLFSLEWAKPDLPAVAELSRMESFIELRDF